LGLFILLQPSFSFQTANWYWACGPIHHTNASCQCASSCGPRSRLHLWPNSSCAWIVIFFQQITQIQPASLLHSPNYDCFLSSASISLVSSPICLKLCLHQYNQQPKLIVERWASTRVHETNPSLPHHLKYASFVRVLVTTLMRTINLELVFLSSTITFFILGLLLGSVCR